MADVDRKVVVTGNAANRGATILAVIIAFVLLLILLVALFGGQLLGGSDPTDVKVNVKSS